MQSGSDSVLRRMRRRWGSQRYVDRCRLVQEKLDRPAITTDIIVGFPGETDAEFQETIAAARTVGFSKIHIFPFSPRRGTPAADMPNQIPKHVQQERSRELAAVEAELRNTYYQCLLGHPLRVLVETRFTTDGEQPVSYVSPAPDPSPWLGTSCRYATVKLPATPADEGNFIETQAIEIHSEHIVAARRE
jgi:threonylcarbamoyladenosine tRNA methylthiotransferase MtaB